jgi:hypothetical protein
MADVDFGNVALFYSAADTLVDDASYDGKNTQQDQTRRTIDCLRQYFKKQSPMSSVAFKKVVEQTAPAIDDFFS